MKTYISFLVGFAIASALVVVSVKAQNVAGGTLSGTTVTATATSNQFVIGTTNLDTLSFTAPGASRTITFADPGANDSVVYLAATQTLTGKTLTAPTVSAITAGAQKFLLTGSGTGPLQLAATQTTPPTCSSNCGTTVPAIAGTDTAGIVTMGSGGSPASAWVVSFNAAWAAAPTCVVQSALSSMVVGKMPIAVVTTVNNFTVTTNGTAPATSDKYQYVCFGVQ